MPGREGPAVLGLELFDLEGPAVLGRELGGRLVLGLVFLFWAKALLE